MNLDDLQRTKVSEWIGQGAKLSEIQSRLANELGLRLTYMEVRLLVDDLKLTPKDVELPRAATTLRDAATASAPPVAVGSGDPARALGKVSVSVDQLARPGAVVSGKVAFSDGMHAEWYLDQSGRLALASAQPGYRPPAADLQEFQAALDAELSKLGL